MNTREYKGVTLYSDRDVKVWQQERDNLDHNNQRLVKDMQTSRSEIRSLESTRDRVSQEVARLRGEIATQKARIAEEEERVARRREEVKNAPSGNGLQAASAILSGISVESDHYSNSRAFRSACTAFENLLRPQEAEYDRLSSEIHRRENEMDSAESRIKTNNRRKDVILNELRNATAFLDEVYNHPEQLCSRLSAEILQKAQQYDYDHPAGQNDRIRLALYEIAEKVQLIKSHESRQWHTKYAQLCGFLWATFNLLNVAEDEELAQIIGHVLRQTHIAENEDLPGRAALGRCCINMYRDSYRSMSIDDLKHLERQQYDRAYQKLDTALNRHGEDLLKQHATAVLHAIRDEVKTNPDYKFFTKLLNSTHGVLTTPLNEEVRRHHHHLANHATGHPSFGRKLGGALLGLAGALLITSSIFMAVATFGASTPLSIFAISSGISLIGQACIVASVGLAGVGAVLGGGFLFKSGMRKGMSKEMVKLEDEKAKTSNSTASREVKAELGAPLLRT